VGEESDWESVSAAGDCHTLAIKKDGSLWAWGWNQSGQLGLGDTTRRTIPTRVGAESNWAMVSACRWHSLAIKKDGSLWNWPVSGQHIPTRIGAESDWAVVSAGMFDPDPYAIKKDGSLWTWYPYYGEYIPTRINDDSDWAMVSTASRVIWYAIKKDGSLWQWGERMGVENDWAAVSAGDGHTLAIKKDGSLWTWGRNIEGQLGLGYGGGESFVDVPTRVTVK
jgi:hypothetical protein